MNKIFDWICWLFWMIGVKWDDLCADVQARWETRGMTTDELIAHIKAKSVEGPQDRFSMVAAELCDTLEKSRRGNEGEK